MQEFWIRVVSIIMIVGMMLGYNVKLEERKKDDEIARLSALVESAQNVQDDSMAGVGNDGTYTGEAEGFGGAISVEVTIEQGQITVINILSAKQEDGAYLAMAEDIIPDIIDAQSAEVDTISGATFSSTGIRDAVKQALEKAVE